MPLQQSYFQPLSFQQASPMVSGMEAGSNIASNNSMDMLRNMQAAQTGIQNAYLPSSLAQSLKSQKLANALAQSKLPFAAPQAQANLGLTNAQTGLVQGQTSAIPSQIALQQAQAGLAGANTGLVNAQTQIMPFNALGKVDPVSQLLYSRALLQRMFGNNPGGSPPPITSNNGGMTVQAAGNPQSQQVPTTYSSLSQYPVLPGGTSLSAGAAGARGAAIPAIAGNGMGALNSIQPGSSLADNLYSTSLNNMIMGMGKNPTMGSNRSGAGGTYVNPITGEQYSTPTSKNATMDQQTVASAPRINELIPQIYKNLGQFQTLGAKADLYKQKLGNLFGQNNALPSDQAAGEAQTKLVAESLLRAYGLNVTDQSTDFMMSSIEPKLGESQGGYKNRLDNTASILKANQQQAAGRLQGGIPLNQSPQQAQQSNGVPQSQGISIPSFTSKSEFQEWYKQQAPQQQAMIRQQLGSA